MPTRKGRKDEIREAQPSAARTALMGLVRRGKQSDHRGHDQHSEQLSDRLGGSYGSAGSRESDGKRQIDSSPRSERPVYRSERPRLGSRAAAPPPKKTATNVIPVTPLEERLAAAKAKIKARQEEQGKPSEEVANESRGGQEDSSRWPRDLRELPPSRDSHDTRAAPSREATTSDSRGPPARRSSRESISDIRGPPARRNSREVPSDNRGPLRSYALPRADSSVAKEATCSDEKINGDTRTYVQPVKANAADAARAAMQNGAPPAAKAAGDAAPIKATNGPVNGSYGVAAVNRSAPTAAADRPVPKGTSSPVANTTAALSASQPAAKVDIPKGASVALSKANGVPTKASPPQPSQSAQPHSSQGSYRLPKTVEVPAAPAIASSGSTAKKQEYGLPNRPESKFRGKRPYETADSSVGSVGSISSNMSVHTIDSDSYRTRKLRKLILQHTVGSIKLAFPHLAEDLIEMILQDEARLDAAIDACIQAENK